MSHQQENWVIRRDRLWVVALCFGFMLALAFGAGFLLGVWA